jgi:hypothetical protein
MGHDAHDRLDRVALFWLAKTESVTKTVTKARDSFWQGLTRGDADAVGSCCWAR